MTNQAWLPSTHIYTHYTARQDVLCALVQLTRPLQSIYCVYTLVFVQFNNLADEASFMRRKSRAVSRSPSERTRGFHMCHITSFNKRWNPLAGVEICTPMSDDYRPNAITCHHHQFPPLVSLYPALCYVSMLSVIKNIRSKWPCRVGKFQWRWRPWRSEAATQPTRHIEQKAAAFKAT